MLISFSDTIIKNRDTYLTFAHDIWFQRSEKPFPMKRDRNPNIRKHEDEVVGRYENFIKGEGVGYFEVDELETIINHYMDDAKTEEAMNAVQYGRKLHPNSTSLLVKQARLYADTGKTKEAISIIDYIQTIDSADEDAALLKGEIYLRKGLVDEAMHIFKGMERNAGNDDACTFLNIAYALNDNGRYDDALYFLDKAYAIDKNNTDTLFEQAFSYEQKSEYDKAIETYNRILDLTPLLQRGLVQHRATTLLRGAIRGIHRGL